MRSRNSTDAIHGFFSTPAGQLFLRDMYRQYLMLLKAGKTKTKFGEKKLASNIADNNSVNQNLEDGLTLKALQRWAKKDQKKLWLDEKKSRRVLQRLEVEMMQEPVIRELCDDRAQEFRRHTVAVGLASFLSPSGSRADLLAKHEGVFEVFPQSGRTQKMLRGILEEEGEIDAAEAYNPLTRIFWKMKNPGSEAYLLVQEFSLSEDGVEGPFLRRSGGFVFFPDDWRIIRLMIDHAAPLQRWIEYHSRAHLTDREPHNGYRDDSIDFGYQMAAFSLSPLATTSSLPNQFDRDGVGIRRCEPSLARFINKRFDPIMWEIMV